ncbi:RNA-directed DNA polymerase, partial [Citrobacter freundii]|nr:RNA-directed DNA polymerase [Citrobacter freundii]
MEVNTNFRLLLWGLSIIQPSSPEEVSSYLKAVLNDDGLLPDSGVMEDYFVKLKNIGYIEQVSRRNNLFSITPQGNEKLPPKLKKLRDKIRIFLLDKCYTQSKLERLASTETEKMSGDSPFLQLRHISKEVPHPSL